MIDLKRSWAVALALVLAPLACDAPSPVTPVDDASRAATLEGPRVETRDALPRMSGSGDDAFGRIAALGGVDYRAMDRAGVTGSEPATVRAENHGNGGNGGPKGLAALAKFTGKPPVTPALALDIIGPGGGSLSLDGFEIVVPPGAVDRNTLFAIRRPLSAFLRQYVVMEIYPHNVTFDVPVTVRMPLAGTTDAGHPDAEPVRWSWTHLDWERFDGTETPDGRIEVAVDQFSIWGVSRHGVMFGELSSGGE